jgi:hypothetical protein
LENFIKQKHPAKGGKEGTKREKTQGVLSRRANPKFKGGGKRIQFVSSAIIFFFWMTATAHCPQPRRQPPN